MNKLIYFDEISQSLSIAVYHAHANLKNMSGLLRMTIQSGMWRKRILTVTGDIVEFESFEAYVIANPPYGLGTDIQTLKWLCGNDKELIGLIEKANEIQLAELEEKQPDRLKKFRHLSKDWTIQKLMDDGKHELAKDVLMGKVTPYSAQMQMGWRKKTKSKRITTKTDKA